MTAPLARVPPQRGSSPRAPAVMPLAQRESIIREEAYALAERRGFAPGHELNDWLAAEHKIDELLASSPAVGGSEAMVESSADAARMARKEGTEGTPSPDLRATKTQEQKPQWFGVPRAQWFSPAQGLALGNADLAAWHRPGSAGVSAPANDSLRAVDLARLADEYRAALARSRTLSPGYLSGDTDRAVRQLDGVIAAINELMEPSRALVGVRIAGACWDQHWRLLNEALVIPGGEELEERIDAWVDELLQTLFLSDRAP
jgi:hypothetical protein